MMEFRPCRRRKAIGIGCLALGPVGIILPILPGAIFVVLGTFILRDQYAWAYRSVGVVDRRWPHLLPTIEAREQKAMDWGNRQIDKARGWISRTPPG
ncbi:YbaN family protein [Roseococcus pinisoli]|uniref:Transmembrane protein (PGPGW) n=1 Tax=Roseococcus pinisoli TaxID=2835040 RepID=A0ABS5Q8H9_9PROT|nr:hypothetical protein [Roseococcus pinisoli]MBS7810014.1 hypothetical protein [Roseococcus pinisoli]